jgi:IS5 family transposase
MIITLNVVLGHIDEIVMVKMLVLQSWYGLSDPELERQANDRISFHKFLGFPERIPDRSTVWAFRERLIDTDKDEKIWIELQNKLIPKD